MTNHPNRGHLITLLRARRASFWPPAAPFDDKDVVICFRTTEDAAAFSEALTTLAAFPDRDVTPEVER